MRLPRLNPGRLPIVPVLVTLVLGAAAYEAALAFGWTATRPLSERPSEWIVPLVAFAGLVLLALAFLVAARGAPLRAQRAVPLALPAAAALLAARFYSYDPYYLPTLRRLSDGGVVEPAWTYGLIAAATIIEVVILLRLRLGLLLAAPLLLLIAGTLIVAVTGH
jgi:hypothetical protein